MIQTRDFQLACFLHARGTEMVGYDVVNDSGKRWVYFYFDIQPADFRAAQIEYLNGGEVSCKKLFESIRDMRRILSEAISSGQ